MDTLNLETLNPNILKSRKPDSPKAPKPPAPKKTQGAAEALETEVQETLLAMQAA